MISSITLNKLEKYWETKINQCQSWLIFYKINTGIIYFTIINLFWYMWITFQWNGLNLTMILKVFKERKFIAKKLICKYLKNKGKWHKYLYKNEKFSRFFFHFASFSTVIYICNWKYIPKQTIWLLLKSYKLYVIFAVNINYYKWTWKMGTFSIFFCIFDFFP